MKASAALGIQACTKRLQGTIPATLTGCLPPSARSTNSRTSWLEQALTIDHHHNVSQRTRSVCVSHQSAHCKQASILTSVSLGPKVAHTDCEHSIGILTPCREHRNAGMSTSGRPFVAWSPLASCHAATCTCRPMQVSQPHQQSPRPAFTLSLRAQKGMSSRSVVRTGTNMGTCA